MIVAAIHQPNFLPWLGYFDKIAKADKFIFLDDVQLVKTGGSWVNRVKVPDQKLNEGRWLSLPIKKPSGVQKINETQFCDPSSLGKAFKTIQMLYSRHPFFSEVIKIIEACFSYSTNRLSEWNIHAIRHISESLGISQAKFRLASEFESEKVATERLVELTKSVGADLYLCGGGSSEYFREDLFQDAGLRVEYQNFRHPSYPQYRRTTFVSGLTIIDFLMNVGVDQTRRAIGSG